ncbi:MULTISPECIES: aldo/keto reductase [unclassified Sphingomonas]|uniref:aldo/keto reductase n=1 Tax=unclassified Sphingomonas TaxID=196159 RepID=UPI0006FF5CD0|nr:MULTISPECIES: aldo/keto reductase [unclassified Sphingomonas]KQM26299.1 pyridoxal 4-dehydrogenase [Sphingomonas sp. Leaf9]KQM42707.1 pyridoxal 4-dehydrogenase [Sphingomonas sp. Leaf11]
MTHGLVPAKLGFGGAAIGNLYRPVGDDAARATIDAAWDRGIRCFDTAPHYGFGLSERRLGDALADLDPDRHAFVSTKVGRVLRPAPDRDPAAERQGFVSPEPVESAFDYSRDGVLASFDASRARLRRDRIDLLLAHDLGELTHGADAAAQMATFLDGGYSAMRQLRDAGVVGAIGIGVNEIAVCEDLLDRVELDAILLAGRYTLLEQAALDTLLPRCAARGVRVIVGGPYNSGILASGTGPDARYNYEAPPAEVTRRVDAIAAICARHAVPMAAAALQFPMAHPAVTAVIPGMADVGEVAQAATLATMPLPGALWTDLIDAGLIRADAPVPMETA